MNEVDDLLGEPRVELSEMLGHILDKGVVLRGEVMLAVADIDLIKLDLGLLLTGVETVLRRQQARSLASAEVESVGELPDSTESETVRALNPPSSAAVVAATSSLFITGAPLLPVAPRSHHQHPRPRSRST